MKLEKQACMLALAAILLLIVGAFVVGFPAGATLAEETDIDLNAFEGSVILEDPVYFQEATPDEPEVKPTQQPTIEPTQAPGEQPTVEPTHEPTAEPADAKFTVQITPPTGWRNTASAQACVDMPLLRRSCDGNGEGLFLRKPYLSIWNLEGQPLFCTDWAERQQRRGRSTDSGRCGKAQGTAL